MGDLVEALTSESAFRTVVQPIFDPVSERAVAHELLSRGPEGAFESPDDFFRISAENDILTTVDLLLDLGVPFGQGYLLGRPRRSILLN